MTPSLAQKTIAPEFFSQHEICPLKVRRTAAHILRGGSLPKPVVARYGDQVMPLDGHHRLSAHKLLGLPCEVLECSGEALEDLAMDVGSFEADRVVLSAAARLTPHKSNGE